MRFSSARVHLLSGVELEGQPGLKELTIKEPIRVSLPIKGTTDTLVIEIPANTKTDMSSIPVGKLTLGFGGASLLALTAMTPGYGQIVCVCSCWGASYLTAKFRPRALFPAGCVHDGLYAGTYTARIVGIDGVGGVEVRLSRKTADLVYFWLVMSNCYGMESSANRMRLVTASAYYCVLRVAASSHYDKDANLPSGDERLI